MQKEPRTGLLLWGEHDREWLNRYFNLLHEQNRRLPLPENDEDRKALLQRQGYLSEKTNHFTLEGVLLFGKPRLAGLCTDVVLVDERQEIARETRFPDYPLLELYEQLVQALKMLWERRFSSTAIRDKKTWGEKIFFEYPKEAILEALSMSLVRRDYREENVAEVTLTSDCIQFQYLSSPNPRLDKAFREMGLGHGEEGGVDHIRAALQDNLSYRQDGSLGLETGKNYLTLFRRDPARTVLYQPESAFSSYEAGLRRLLERLGPGHPRYPDVLAYRQRLSENIELTRVRSDTETRRAERSEIISWLNALALSTAGVSFNELSEHNLPPSPPPEVPVTVLVPAGPFWMGSSPEDTEAHENEKPRRKCELEDYRIGRYPVTNAQYACFLGANPQYPVPHADEENARPYNWDPQARTYPGDKADHPVVLVDWEDAEAYCRWLSQITGKHHRLPTEEEWEKAARGSCPDTRLYPWGDDWRPGCCNTQELGQRGTTSVYEFEQTNRSPFGVVDMAGNVWEWTASWYESYTGSPYASMHFGRLHRIIRGGSWRNFCREARISCRGRYPPDTRRPYVGFRIVLD